MAVPARESAAAREPADPDRHDPRARGWADVRQALITDSHAVALAAAEVAARPGDPAALAMLGLTLEVLERLGEIGRRWAADEAVMAQERERGYAEGYAACKAARCRLAVVDSG